MLRPPLVVTHVAVSKGLFPSPQGVTPRGMWALLAGMYRYEVPYRTAEYAESRR